MVYIAPPENPAFLYHVAGMLGMGRRVARLTQDRIERRFGLPFESARGAILAPKLEVPLLVIHDAGDTEVPYEEGARLAQLWPGAELMTTEGLGHARILRAPVAVEAAVGFVTSSDVEVRGQGSRTLVTGHSGLALPA